MKYCPKCALTLPLDMFDAQATGKLGKRSDCKECRKKYVRTKQGVAKTLYTYQKSKSKMRGYALPSYSEAELFAWLMNQPKFHTLYDTWVASGYLTNLKPSVDRIDDYYSYTIPNIQVMTWGENSTKAYQDQMNGNNNKKSEAVDMLTLDGLFIERFYSVSAAARRFNGIPSNIIGVINKRTTRKKLADGSYRTWIPETAYGHKWRYSSTPNDNSEKT